MTTTDPTKPHICTADGGPACPGHTPNCEPGCAQPAAAADSTGRPPRASEITLADVMDRIGVTAAELWRQINTIAGALNDGAPGWSQAMALRSQLAEALVQAETERDEARADLRPEAPETAPKSPHSQDHTQVRGDSRTEASAGADGPWSDAWCRTQLQRLSIAASEQYGLRWRDYDVVGAVIEELATLHARNREWEQTLGDLAARCDSGDIPIRLGERYSVAVLREIDRALAEIDRLRTALNTQGGSR